MNKLEGLDTKCLGREFCYFNEIDSTQTEIWRRIENKTIKNGTVVMADIQTMGKGTHGRVWHTDEKENIAFSFYIETNNKISKFEGLTIQIAEIITKIFKRKYNIEVKIKHPNDLMINDKKFGGILTESKVNADCIKYLVVGIGINTNKTCFSEDIKDLATSIKKEYGISIDKYEFITEFCNEFENHLNERIK